MPQTPIPIAFCITELDPGGAERAFVRLVTGLDRNRWTPEVFALSSEGELTQPLREANIPVTSFGLNRNQFLGGIFRLRAELRRRRPLLLQTFLFHANILGRLAACGTSVKHVVSGIRVAEQRSPWYHALDRWTERFVSRHVCVSESVKQFSASHGLSQKKLLVIPNGVDVPLFDRTPPADLSLFGLPPDSFAILAAGRLDPQKGLDLLLRAFDLFALNHPEAHLLIAGEGPQRSELESNIRSLASASRIHLLGRRNDLPALLKAADLFVLSSRWEGMPNVLLEAAAAAIPIVATDVEGVAEILGGKTGDDRFRFGGRAEPDDIKSLSHALQTASTAGITADSLAREAREFVLREYSWEQMTARYSSLYEDLLRTSLPS